MFYCVLIPLKYHQIRFKMQSAGQLKRSEIELIPMVLRKLLFNFKEVTLFLFRFPELLTDK